METKQHATKKYQWVNDEIKEDIENSLRQMTMKIQPLWDAAKAGLRGKFIVIQAFLKK